MRGQASSVDSSLSQTQQMFHEASTAREENALLVKQLTSDNSRLEEECNNLKTELKAAQARCVLLERLGSGGSSSPAAGVRFQPDGIYTGMVDTVGSEGDLPLTEGKGQAILAESTEQARKEPASTKRFVTRLSVSTPGTSLPTMSLERSVVDSAASSPGASPSSLHSQNCSSPLARLRTPSDNESPGLESSASAESPPSVILEQKVTADDTSTPPSPSMLLRTLQSKHDAAADRSNEGTLVSSSSHASVTEQAGETSFDLDEEMVAFLNHLGLQDCREPLVSEKVVSLARLKVLTEEDLQFMGLRIGERRLLYAGIRELKETTPTQSTSTSAALGQSSNPVEHIASSSRENSRVKRLRGSDSRSTARQHDSMTQLSRGFSGQPRHSPRHKLEERPAWGARPRQRQLPSRHSSLGVGKATVGQTK